MNLRTPWRRLACALGVAIVLSGTASAAPALGDDMPPVPEPAGTDIVNFIKTYIMPGLDGAKVLIGVLGLLGADSGPSLEDIQQQIDAAVVDIKRAIVESADSINDHLNRITAADISSCRDKVEFRLNHWSEYQDRSHQLQAFTEAHDCLIDSIHWYESLNNGTDDGKGLINSLYVVLNAILMNVATMASALSIPGSNAAPSASAVEPDLSYLRDVRTREIALSETVGARIAPQCGWRRGARGEGGRADLIRWCRAFTGKRAEKTIRNGLGQAPPPAYDYTALQNEAMLGTAWEASAKLLPVLRQPIVANVCTSAESTVRCSAYNFELTAIPVTTIRWWRNGVAVPAWNDLLEVSAANGCTPGLAYEVRTEMTNAAGQRGEATNSFVCRGNVAAGKTTTASKPACSSATAARFATDGNASTYACIAGPNNWQDGSRWLQIDLGTTYPIQNMKIRHAGDLQGFRPVDNTYAYNVDVSTDGSHWATVVVCEDNEASLTTHSFNGPVNARYVRVVVWEPNSLFGSAYRSANIVEIEAYT